MGLFSFVKEAGASLLGIKTGAQKEAEAQEAREAARQAKEASIRAFVGEFGLGIDSLGIAFSGEDDDTVILTGEAATQADKEKLILSVGNIQGIACVDDQMTVTEPEPAPPAVFHTVVRGDSLSKIAKAYLGSANRYPEIFEANKPMLKDPNLIYPGQVLRIPGAEMPA